MTVLRIGPNGERSLGCSERSGGVRPSVTGIMAFVDSDDPAWPRVIVEHMTHLRDLHRARVANQAGKKIAEK